MEFMELIVLLCGCAGLSISMYSLGFIKGTFAIEKEYDKLLDDYEKTIENYAKACDDYKEACNNYKRIAERTKDELSQHIEG